MKIPINRRKIRSVRAVVAAGALLAVAGCADAMQVGVPDIAHQYSPLELSAYGSGGNELRVEVHGDPFGAGPAATAAATVAAMQGNVFGTPVAFALAPVRERRPPSRVVVYFNPRQLVGAEGLCNPATPITTAPADGGPLRVVAAWCQTNFSLTENSARANGIGGLDSPKFRALVGQLTTSLFPPRNPHIETRRGCPPFCR
jgi:hypothetical protein